MGKSHIKEAKRSRPKVTYAADACSSAAAEAEDTEDRKGAISAVSPRD